jgi:hypothetical protein
MLHSMFGRTKLRGGYKTHDRRLDRLPSETDEHIRKYPLTLSTLPAVPTPMAIGINWYRKFSEPVKGADGRWRIVPGPGGDLGQLDGGHCICLANKGFNDYASWWAYYDQLQEGRCGQFGTSRMMTLLNRRRYEIRESVPQGRWLYWQGQRHDEWPGGSYPGASPTYEGTSVNAELWVIKNEGIIPYGASKPSLADGISTFRWATSDADVWAATGWVSGGEVPWLNSWGRDDYPHVVWVPKEVHSRLRSEDGEYGVVTDK